MGEYCEGQWWLKELDAMAKTPDQRRAVAVVRKMMAEQHQSEPVAWVHPAYLKPGAIGFEASVTRLADAQVPLYTHADPGEVERLRDKLTKINELIFATGAPLGGDVYFQIREICAEELRYEVRHV